MKRWYLPRSLRSAASSAFTGPLPSAAEISTSSPTFTFTSRGLREGDEIAGGVVAALDIHLEPLHREEGGTSPITRLARRKKEASAPS